MKNNLIKFLKIGLPLFIGAWLIYYSYNQFTNEQLEQIYAQIKGANYYYVIVGLILALLSHLSRAWRWNYMLSQFGKPPTFLTNITAIGIGYAMNIFIPRSGELSRAIVVNRNHGIPVNKAIGTIVAERVLDFGILLLITAIALLLSQDVFLEYFIGGFKSAFAKANSSQLLLYLAIVISVILLGIFLIKRLGLYRKVLDFLKGMKEGFSTIWTMKKKWLYLIHTFFIWFMYLAMFYVSVFAISYEGTFAVAAILAAFVAGSFAVAFTNGGFGAYPFLIAQVLLLFHVPETVGTSLGWILWLSQTALVLVYGLISFILLSLKK